jgi:hypothetical protein
LRAPLFALPAFLLEGANFSRTGWKVVAPTLGLLSPLDFPARLAVLTRKAGVFNWFALCGLSRS